MAAARESYSLDVDNSLQSLETPGQQDTLASPVKARESYSPDVDNSLQSLETATSSTLDASDVCLLLVGKSGHGTSATGNSILGSMRFKEVQSMKSVTKNADMGSENIDGRTIKVVDTPGLFDTNLALDESVRKTMDAFVSGIALCPDGFHALVLVCRSDVRMTKEEVCTLQILKEMLGKDVIREYAVLVFTHGDTFQGELKGRTFIEWCKEEMEFLKDTILECNNRCVLFNNRTKDSHELDRQRQELLDFVNKIQSEKKCFTNWIFETAQKTWEQLNRQRKYVKIINKVNAALEKISRQLHAALKEANDINKATFDGLMDEVRKLKGLTEDLEQPDKGELELHINVMQMSILNAWTDLHNRKSLKKLKELLHVVKIAQQAQEEKLNAIQNAFKEKQITLYDVVGFCVNLVKKISFVQNWF